MNIKELDEAATIIIVYKNGKVNIMNPNDLKVVILGFTQYQINKIIEKILKSEWQGLEG
jgi:NACalpha-BTF3-like transcription factor